MASTPAPAMHAAAVISVICVPAHGVSSVASAMDTSSNERMVKSRSENTRPR